MRNLRVKTIVIATMGLALVFAGMPGTAEAGVCSKVGVGNGCVNSKDVKDNRLRAVDHIDEAGADFASGEQFVELTNADAIVRAVTITAPTAGRVIVNASGVFRFTDGIIFDSGQCSITTGAALDFSHLIVAEEESSNAMFFVPFGGTRGFDVAAGSTTFNLVCDEFSGDVFVEDTSLTAIFVPTAY